MWNPNFLAISPDELTEPIPKSTKCPNCGKQHRVQSWGADKDNPSRCVHTVKCPVDDDHYFVGVHGMLFKQRVGRKP